VGCCVTVLVGAMCVELEEVHLLVALGVGHHFSEEFAKKNSDFTLPKG
jgi:hypothetical protein